MSNQQYLFGTGFLTAVRSDIPNATPVKFGALQDVSVDFSFTQKELMGQYQFPLAVARGASKVGGKAKNAQINSVLFNQIFFGQTSTTGQTVYVNNEAGAVPAASTYTVTVVNESTYVADMGVVNAATATPMTKVASSPAQGQYSEAAGVYTFASADANLAVLISYTHTVTSGNSFTLVNPLMGIQPTFSVTLSNPYGGNNFTLILNACIATKLTINSKYEDFTIPEFDFSAFVDGNGNLGSFSMSN